MHDCNLICLPPAGAGPSIFQPWRQVASAVTALGIPGREARFSEPQATSLHALANRLALELVSILPEKYALFGYSMGGTVAFLLAQTLVRLGKRQPEAFFVLGAPPPHLLHRGLSEIASLPSKDFWHEINRIGGTPMEVMQDAEIRSLLEPSLKHDFQMCSDYRFEETKFRLTCPLHVFLAEEDHLVGQDQAAEWAGYGEVRHHSLPGGHMLEPFAFRALLGQIKELCQPLSQPT